MDRADNLSILIHSSPAEATNMRLAISRNEGENRQPITPEHRAVFGRAGLIWTLGGKDKKKRERKAQV